MRNLFGFTLALCSVMCIAACQPADPLRTAENPDPNHTHADFAIYIDDEKLDFSAVEFMSGAYDYESEEGVESDDHPHDDEDSAHDHLHPYLHLHDGVGHVVHRHKPGLSLEEFFDSLQIAFDEYCYASLAPLAEGRICSENPLRMFINGEEVAMDVHYAFEDLDQILITSALDDATVQQQLQDMTDDSCLYSRTCPQRGDPPEENCVADPAIPCVTPGL